MRFLTTLTILALGANAVAAPLEPYQDLKPAVLAALADAESLAPQFEAGGTIYQCGTAFAYLAPVTQRKKNHVAVEIFASAECSLVAMYHTHPKGDSRFSVDDIRAVCAAKTVSFIKPKGGAVRMFDCRELSIHAQEAALRGEPISHGIEI